MTWVVGSRKVEKNQKLVYVPPFTEKYPLGGDSSDLSAQSDLLVKG
jgi:hypothetical protein